MNRLFIRMLIVVILTLIILPVSVQSNYTFQSTAQTIVTYPWANVSIRGEGNPKKWTAYGALQLSKPLSTTTIISIQFIGLNQTLDFTKTIDPNITFSTWTYRDLPSWAENIKILPTDTITSPNRLIPITYNGAGFQLIIPNHETSANTITKFKNRHNSPLQMVAYGDHFTIDFQSSTSTYNKKYEYYGVQVASQICFFNGPHETIVDCPNWPEDLPNGKYVVTITVTTVDRYSVTATREIWMGITYTHIPLVIK